MNAPLWRTSCQQPPAESSVTLHIEEEDTIQPIYQLNKQVTLSLIFPVWPEVCIANCSKYKDVQNC